MKTKWVFLLVGLGFFCSISAAVGQVRPVRNKTTTSNEVRFRKIVVDKTFRSEGVAVGDVNHDGKTDILAGDVWYEAPKWKMHEVRPVGQCDGSESSSNCFANFVQDINGDGWVDSIIFGLPVGPCLWYENPKNKHGHWKQRMVINSACNEMPILVDLLSNGNPVLVYAVLTKGLMAKFSVPNDLDGLWDMHTIVGDPNAPGTKKYSHGLREGDFNGDGRNDVLNKEEWGQAPEDRTDSDWKFDPANLGSVCADILVYDVDDDGDDDIITSSAHNYGIWWFEQLPADNGSQFKQHLISKKVSQSHAIRLIDINGDRIKDLVTGKRHLAHMGKDPGGKDPAMLYWFELSRPKKGKVEFTMHVIDDDSGVGTQFEVIDINGDNMPDIVTSNKKGVHVFLQTMGGGNVPRRIPSLPPKSKGDKTSVKSKKNTPAPKPEPESNDTPDKHKEPGPETPPKVSGDIKESDGSGISDVTVNFSNGGGSAITSSIGYYSMSAPNGWSGTATPSKTGYTFIPTSKSYSNVTSDKSNENYTGSELSDEYPDLIIPDINVPEPVIFYGAQPPTLVTFTVKNNGSGPVSGVPIRGSIVNATHNGLPLVRSEYFDISYTSPLAAGEEATHSFAVGHNSYWPVGTYTLQVEIDYNNLVQELTETNNISEAISFVVVWEPSPRAPFRPPPWGVMAFFRPLTTISLRYIGS